MAKQFLAIFRETARGTNPGTNPLFPPVIGSVEPIPEYTDQPRKEFRGQDTRLGDVNDTRVSTSWKYDLTSWFYPIEDLMAVIRHVVGFAGVRAVVDTSAYKGILYPPSAPPYAANGELDGEALTLVANTDKDGTTVAQDFSGGRPTGLKIECQRPDDVKLTVPISGGPWIGDAGQAATAGESFTALQPYNSADLTCYVGTGISRTGVAPDFTDLAPGTMVAFAPDNLTLEFETGAKDVEKLNGLRGPSVTEYESQVIAKLTYSMDFSDPASGFSSYDQYLLHCAGPLYHSYLFKLTGPDLAGAATAYHQFIADLPRMKMKITVKERTPDGKVVKADFEGESRFDATAKYPFAFMTVDQVETY